MPRKTIHRDIHQKGTKLTKPLKVVGATGHLKVPSDEPVKVSKASKPKKVEAPKPKAEPVKKETEALKVDLEVSEVELKDQKPEVKKEPEKKSTRRGRPRKSSKSTKEKEEVLKVDEKDED